MTKMNTADAEISSDGALRSRAFGDVYFQTGQAAEESAYVFLEGNGLPQRFAGADVFTIGELGFGTGLNFLLTLDLWRKVAPPQARLVYVSVEKFPFEKRQLEKILSFWPQFSGDAARLLESWPPAAEGFSKIVFGNVDLVLCLGDAAQVLPDVAGAVDAWYLDGFAPAKNPDMWGPEILDQLARLSAPGASFATFTAAGAVRRGLEERGFTVEKTKGFGVKRDMLKGHRAGSKIRAEKEKHVAIIGAGVAGCAAAHAFARRGWRVDIYDRNHEPAQETSGNPVGVIYPKLTAKPSPQGDFYRQAFLFTQSLLRDLPDTGWNPCGVIDLFGREGEYPEELAHMVHGRAAAEISGLPLDTGGLYFPGGGVIEPQRYCRALLNHPGIAFHGGRNVKDLSGFSAVVLSGNLGVKEFSQTAWLPLQPVRGQITAVAADETSAKLKCVINHDGYFPPAVGGVHYMGATFERDTEEAVMREEDNGKNLEALARNIGCLKELAEQKNLRGRAGIRAATPDRLPLAGRCPVHESFVSDKSFHDGVFVISGLGSHGMTTAPLLGEIVAAQCNGETLPLPASVLSHIFPERFILRAAKKKQTICGL